MSKIISLLQEFAKKRGIIEQTYLVGGTVRDIITNKKIHDYDITINEDVITLIKIFSDEISASFIILDEKYGIVRVAKEGEFVDFSTMKGDSIRADLSMRDFTINAMAINLSEFKDFSDGMPSLKNTSTPLQNLIIDPFNGLTDLKHKIIRMLSEENLLQDPLRLLRAYRFSSCLNFTIEINTHDAICKLSPYISNVAVERIAEELRHILLVNSSYKTIRDMHESGLLLNIFPELKNINIESLHSNINTYKSAEYVLNNLSFYFSDHELISNYFAENYRIVCLKLSILFSSTLAISIAERLKMSRKEVQLVNMIEELYKDFIELKNVEKTKKIDFLRLFSDVLYPLIIFAIAKELVCCPNESTTLFYCKEMLEIYHQEIIPKKKLLPIITGDDLIKEFKLSPSPLFKSLLDEIEVLFLEGSITNKKEALATTKEILKRGLFL